MVWFCLWLTGLNLAEGCQCGPGVELPPGSLKIHSLVTPLKTMTSFLQQRFSAIRYLGQGWIPLILTEHLLNQGLSVLGFGLIRSYGLIATAVHFWVPLHDMTLSPSSSSQALCVPSSACSHMKHNFKFSDCLFDWVRDFIEDNECDVIEVLWILFLNLLGDLSLESHSSYNTRPKELFLVIKKKRNMHDPKTFKGSSHFLKYNYCWHF